MVGGLSVPVTPQEVPKATETTSQSEYLAPPQLLLTCFHPPVTPRANTKHTIILFYLPFRQPKWPRLNPPHDPHGQSGDMYTPSLLEHLRLKWDEETDKGLTLKMPEWTYKPLQKVCSCLIWINAVSWIHVYLSSRLNRNQLVIKIFNSSVTMAKTEATVSKFKQQNRSRCESFSLLPLKIHWMATFSKIH